MAKRYYLSKVVGSGATGDSYRDALLGPVRSAGVVHRRGAWMPPHDATGKPTLPYCVVALAVADHSPFLALVDSDPLPNYPLDTPLSSVPAGVRSAVATALAARGLAVPNLGAGATVGQFLLAVGRQVHPDFTLDSAAFDVADVT